MKQTREGIIRELESWKTASTDALRMLGDYIGKSGSLGYLVGLLIAENQNLKSSLVNPTKRELPKTRSSITRKFELGHHEIYLICGFYENSQLGEIFVTVAKEGMTLSGLMDHICLIVNLLLQHGIPWAEIKGYWRYARFEPLEDGKYTSILDAVAINVSELVSEFGGLEDRNHLL